MRTNEPRLRFSAAAISYFCFHSKLLTVDGLLFVPMHLCELPPHPLIKTINGSTTRGGRSQSEADPVLSVVSSGTRYFLGN